MGVVGSPNNQWQHVMWGGGGDHFICGCSSSYIGASYLSRHQCLSQGTSDRRSSPGGPKTAPWGPQTALGVLRPQTETMYSEALYSFLSLKCLSRGRVRNIGAEIPWRWSLPECFTSSVRSFTSTLNIRVEGTSALRDMRATRSTPPNVAGQRN